VTGLLLESLDRLGGPAAIFACMAVFTGVSLALVLAIRGRAHIHQEAPAAA
jgi:hypothetical protein